MRPSRQSRLAPVREGGGLEEKAEDLAVPAFSGALDVAPQIALGLEAELGEQPLGAIVASVGARPEALQPEGGGVADHGAHGLQAVADSPNLASEDETDPRPPMPPV